MPAKQDDNPEKPERVERRREKKERSERPERPERSERDKDSKDTMDRERKHRSSHTYRSTSTKEKSASRTSLSSTGSRRQSMPGVIEESTEINASDSRSKATYPTFSKEHSKESVGPRPVYTPPPSQQNTDVNASKEKLANLNRIINNGPPSPPLTERSNVKSTPVRPVTVETIAEEEKRSDSDTKPVRRSKPRPLKSSSSLQKPNGTASPVHRVKSRTVSESKIAKEPPILIDPFVNASQPTRTVSPARNDSASELETILSSDATSIAPEQPSIQRPGSKIPSTAYQSTYAQPSPVVVETHSRQPTPLEFVLDSGSVLNTPSSSGGPPPPPPPPPHMPQTVPRVDYLLQYGGLHHTIPKNLLYAGKPMAVQQAATSPAQHPIVVTNLFEPYNQLLSDFERVMSKNGSLAVATGYKSVARRLLDRLEAVFARDLSAEVCTCSICAFDNEQAEDIRGASWGEILELVSGRKDLPSWPPFAFVNRPQGLGLKVNLAAPMQKLDIDVPEEYREHYIRQSQKTKQSVDKWLNRQQVNDPADSLPEDVDDETLTFAILTHVQYDERPIFKDLLGMIDLPLQPPRRAPSPDRESGLPPRTAPTPMPHKIRPKYIIAAGLAIQRLYRLNSPPRDPETAIFLLQNPSLHHPLATLAAVSSDEWQMLVSGRFDGFLWSGADDDHAMPWSKPANGGYNPQHISRAPSRGATPAYGPTRSRQNSGGNTCHYPRPSTAPGYRSVSGSDIARSGAPIALDEETEIATLAEIERDIYVGMEALEDAFEQLHLRAEGIRRAVRERSAGLAAAAQRRKQSEIEIRAGTPASQVGGTMSNENWDAETDDGLGDDVSELAPDDSASNISSNRRRKHKRRNERRTPVVGAIDEEDELESEGYLTREPSPEKRLPERR